MEKPLSAAKRYDILLHSAREDTEVKRKHVEQLQLLQESFNVFAHTISSSLQSLSKGISDGFGIVAKALSPGQRTLFLKFQQAEPRSTINSTCYHNCDHLNSSQFGKVGSTRAATLNYAIPYRSRTPLSFEEVPSYGDGCSNFAVLK